jgi:hypothetical protein
VNDAEPLRGPTEDEDPYDDAWLIDDGYELRRPPWWRWVAIVLIVSLVVATPFAYALYRWLR